MGIVDEDIARVRELSDIVAVISEHVQLKRVGRRWVGLCPFHAEKSGSFSVNQEQGLYYCFGCGAKGDVITFVREIEHLDFAPAVEKLAATCGVNLRYTDADEGKRRKQKAELLEAVARAVDWYHERLLSAPDAAPARGYLRSRGLSGDEVRRYKLGWAPEGWDVLAKALRLPDRVFVDAGLGFLNQRNRQTDAFRGRVLFPIFDVSGDAVAFGGRILPGGEGPKYKNSSESRIYAKSRTLYGLNWVKAEVVAADEAVVCEGYTDVIGFAAAGVPRAVATCGTALTEDHFRTLRSFARRVVLAFDADAAGQSAAERIYQWERQFDIDVAVAALPAGMDPGDLSREDPDALRRAVEGAQPFLAFRVERVLAGARLDTAEGRARAAEAAMDVVREHPNELVRDQYVMDVATRTRTEPERLRASLRAPARRPEQVGRGRMVVEDRGGEAPPARPRRLPTGPELEALRLLVSDPDEMGPWLHEVLFDDGRCLAAYRALVDAGGDVRAAVEATDPAAAELLQRVAVEETEAEPHDVADRLLEAAAARHLQMLQARARAAEDPLAYADVVRDVKLLVEGLRDPHAAETSADQLLDWLEQQHEEHT